EGWVLAGIPAPAPVWRLAPSHPELLRDLTEASEESGKYFFGFIRIDQGCNQTEAIKAFKKEFRKRWGKTKGGNRDWWRAKLNDLVVMRLWKQFSNRKDAVKRVQHIVKFTIPDANRESFKGCKDYWKERQRQTHAGRGLEPMSKTPEGFRAKVEMTQARRDARTYFQTLFPSQEPLSY